MELSDEGLEEFFGFVMPFLDEKQRRMVAGGLALVLGRGGTSAVTVASGLAESTVRAGRRSAEAGEVPTGRVRGVGAGRPLLVDSDPSLLVDLDDLVSPESRGDPMSPLRWTLKSTRQLRDALRGLKHEVSHTKVGELLRYLGYSLQANSKKLEGSQHADRDGQFRYINSTAGEYLTAGDPVISVDTKKKELVNGVKANNGREWEPVGEPVEVDTHDFPDAEIPKAIPYGVYDVGADEGWVSVGDDHDTGAFAVNAIRAWWQNMGSVRYPMTTRLLITADAGGSNGYRSRLFKVELARLAAETGLTITVCHFPPGTSKWNKIEHRMFSFISMNWRARPLTSYRTIVELVAATTTRTGLRIEAAWDQGHYPTGIKITDKQLQAVPRTGHNWHPEWNYTITPR